MRAGDAARSSGDERAVLGEDVVVDLEGAGLVGSEHLQVLLVQDHAAPEPPLHLAQCLREQVPVRAGHDHQVGPQGQGRPPHAPVDEREVRGGELEPALLQHLLGEREAGVVGQERGLEADLLEGAEVEEVEVAGGGLGAGDHEQPGHPVQRGGFRSFFKCEERAIQPSTRRSRTSRETWRRSPAAATTSASRQRAR